MDARTPRRRVRARAPRTLLFGASALILLGALALPVGFSPSGVEPFQKAAHAKGGGPGAGGPPDHSNAGGNGAGNGNGHRGGLGNNHVASASHGDGEDDDHDGKNKLGKLNAANAADAAFIHANANSTVGQIAIYKQRVLDGKEDGEGEDRITTFADAKMFLETFANKLVTEGLSPPSMSSWAWSLS